MASVPTQNARSNYAPSTAAGVHARVNLIVAEVAVTSKVSLILIVNS